MIRHICRFIAFLVAKWGNSRLSGYSRARCPWCDSWRKHSPTCICATRQELRDAYQWTQGQLVERTKASHDNVHAWVVHYEREKAKNAVLRHENNKLRAAKFPQKKANPAGRDL